MASTGPPQPDTITKYEVEAYNESSGVSAISGKAAGPIRFDSSPGQVEDLLGPAELLAGAFAACLLKNVERFSRILPFQYRGARVHVTAERKDRPPRITAIRYELTIETDETEQRFDLLKRNLLKFGTVYNTLSRACDVRGDIVRGPLSP